MKQIIVYFACLYLLINNVCYAAQLNVSIDERFELTSIVFRLAGAQEYMSGCVPEYTKRIDTYFANHSHHQVVKFIQDLRKDSSLNVGYTVAASSAFLFDIQDSKFIKNDNRPSNEILRCWKYADIVKYLCLLEQFYYDTEFEKFWNDQITLRQEALMSAISFTKCINMEWFDSFFYTQVPDIEMIVGMAIGRNNYAIPNYLSVQNKNAVIIGCNAETNGIPIINEFGKNELLHEICHCYGNIIINEFEKEYIQSFSKIYPSISYITAQHGYGDTFPENAAGESLNELFAISYLIENKDQWVMYKIASSEEMGYIWMSDLVRFMKNFFNQRDIYSSIIDFMPQLVAYYNELPDRWNSLLKKFEAKTPYVASTYPAKNSIVSDDLKEIRIRLSQPVISALGVDPVENTEPIHIGKFRRSKDHKTLIIPIESNLEKGKTYGIQLFAPMIISEDTYHRATENYQLIFKVK
ncbi:MAG: DUF4932 domain-containing protein [Bacteroidales bacterium]|nr:DUF4932 domain-containing protein [Candidatus Egerieousia equi]